MKASYLHRYTELPALLHCLATSTITLLSPRLWDDKNDSRFLERYREWKKLSSVLALCFTQAPERYHHWKVFAPGSSGIRIEFDRDALLAPLARNTDIRSGALEYKTVKELTAIRPSRQKLPFLKRFPFQDEKEFRIIYQDADHVLETKSIPIDRDAISRVVLSPWLPDALVSTVKEVIRGVDGCKKLKVTRTTLIDNEAWQRCADRQVS